MFGICFLTTLATVLYYKNPQMEYPDLVFFFQLAMFDDTGG